MVMHPLIYGNGLIAKSFFRTEFDRKVVIFSSGVSNSSETRASEFLRESLLLEKSIIENKDIEFIYFSSTSVILGANTAYSNHKARMERLVSSSHNNFYIFRLPQVVGLSDNNTLVSSIVRSSVCDGVVAVRSKAVRNLIAVDDISRIVRIFVNNGIGRNEVNTLASDSNISINEIINKIILILGFDVDLTFDDSGDDQSVSIGFLKNNLSIDDVLFKKDYWENVLKKYVPLIEERVVCEKKHLN